MVLTAIAYTVMLWTTLITACMTSARFLLDVFIISFLVAKEARRRMAMRFPRWKAYIDAAFIAVGLGTLWLVVLLGYQGLKALIYAVRRLIGTREFPVRWTRSGGFVPP